MPLTLLLTRPAARSAAFAEAVEARMPGVWVPLISPLMEVVPVGPVPEPAGAGGLVFSSRNGLERFAVARPERLPAACVGEATADRARALGFDVTLTAPTAAALLAALLAGEGPPPPLLYLRGRHASHPLVADLLAGGIAAREQVVYDQRAQPLSAAARAALSAGAVAAVPVFSARSARLLGDALQGVAPESLACTAALAISPGVADALAGSGFGAVHIARQPDAQAMIDLLAAVAKSG